MTSKTYLSLRRNHEHSNDNICVRRRNVLRTGSCNAGGDRMVQHPGEEGEKEEMTVRQYMESGRPIRAVCTWYGTVWEEKHGEMWDALLMQEVKCVSDEDVVFI